MTKERLQRAANAVEQLKQTIVELLDISSEEVKEMSESSLLDIGEHLGYQPQTFRKKLKTAYFTFPELMQLFRTLHYTDDEIAAVFR